MILDMLRQYEQHCSACETLLSLAAMVISNRNLLNCVPQYEFSWVIKRYQNSE